MSRPLPPLVCGVDDRYVEPLCTMMTSLAFTHGDGLAAIRLIVLHRQLAPTQRAAIRTHADQVGLHMQLRPVLADERRFPLSQWASEAVYLRLAIADVVDDEQRVLYIDADTLVLGDLRPLLRHRLDGAAFAAVRDPRNPLVGGGIALPGWRQLGIPRGREYFNSGVLLLDLPQCRREDLFGRARDFLARHPDQVLLWDQDALNVAAADRWVRLDRRWNTFAMSPLVDLPDFIHDDAEPVMPLAQLIADEPAAAVLHFAGPLKPWQPAYPPGPLRDLYQRHRAALAVPR